MQNQPPYRMRIDALGVVAVGLLIFMGLNILQDQGLFSMRTALGAPAAALATAGAGIPDGSSAAALSAPAGPITPAADPTAVPAASPPAGSADPNQIVAPYDVFMVTQGPHGFDYNHAAVDLSAGKDAVIKSPINGVVTQVYIDEWGNTTLVIENERFLVTLLHGLYSVHAGEIVAIGQPVGVESNQGNTYDALGRSCRGRDCGYHTHWNVFDKQNGVNIYPMHLISQ